LAHVPLVPLLAGPWLGRTLCQGACSRAKPLTSWQTGGRNGGRHWDRIHPLGHTLSDLLPPTRPPIFPPSPNNVIKSGFLLLHMFTGSVPVVFLGICALSAHCGFSVAEEVKNVPGSISSALQLSARVWQELGASTGVRGPQAVTSPSTPWQKTQGKARL
jgi:hypothetical protein